MEEFMADVNQSAEDVSKINVHLNRIIKQMQVLPPNFEDFNHAMDHQLKNTNEVNRFMAQLNENVHQIVDALRAIDQQLNGAAQGLNMEVSRF